MLGCSGYYALSRGIVSAVYQMTNGTIRTNQVQQNCDLDEIAGLKRSNLCKAGTSVALPAPK